MRPFARAVMVVIVLGTAFAVTGAPAQGSNAPSNGSGIRLTRAASSGRTGELGPAAARAMREGPLPADPAAVDRAKGRGGAEAQPSPVAQGPSGPGISPDPTTLLAWKGISQVDITPSDSTGTIGTTRYIENINSKVAIYDRTGALINSARLATWWSEVGASAFDPQVMWDPGTERFFYAGDAVFSGSDNRLALGWSKTASPSNLTTDWCKYEILYGSEFPDYPKLGDSRDFAIVGVNVFAGNPFRGSDVIAVGKPPAGTTCPDVATLPFGVGQNLRVGTSVQFTPVPANQTDANSTGWVLTRPAALPATNLGLFKVTRNADGTPNIQTSGTSISVTSFNIPPNAPQSSTVFTLDTLDARLTQAVSAIDPLRNNKVGIWTQHTVAGGAGSMVQWYEIDPVSATLLQSGLVKSRSLYTFNGAISPDRVVNGTVKLFGGSMVLGFDVSSASSFPAIRMVSKQGTDTQSKQVKVKSSPGPDLDFACAGLGYCRWGDYAAATPDPNAFDTITTTGVVWLTSMWTKDGRLTGSSGTSWQTWNWAAQP
jgi:hypothetical protein